MSKRAVRTWAVGTAAMGAVLSVAGVGLLASPAAGTDYQQCTWLKSGTYWLLPTSNFNDVADYGYNYWAEFDANHNRNGWVCFRWTVSLQTDRNDPAYYTYDSGEKGVLTDDNPPKK